MCHTVHLLCKSEYTREHLDKHVAQAQGVNPIDEYGLTPLHIACTTQDEARVNELLLLAADPSMITIDGMTCLHLAARARLSNVLGLLLDNQKCRDLVNMADNDGRTPLHHACRSGRVESVQLLLDAGAIPSLDNERKDVFDACLEFDLESDLWYGVVEIDQYASEFPLEECQSQGSCSIADGLRPKDEGRPSVNDFRRLKGWAGVKYIQSEHDTTRLEEILDLLPHKRDNGRGIGPGPQLDEEYSKAKHMLQNAYTT
ncbi:ankyrin [Myriangium duriaei CBS 260.36]|uniref:Ankyrin n=1 Tax=Myriangium duriaei CBS 260.36 TaxID=1168546 RepID=A0A9P4J4C0_9PEZI|nr:ankyrin [Myriangium duriaei CBS 260.36]